jgi:hypothetical protein
MHQRPVAFPGLTVSAAADYCEETEGTEYHCVQWTNGELVASCAVSVAGDTSTKNPYTKVWFQFQNNHDGGILFESGDQCMAYCWWS